MKTLIYLLFLLPAAASVYSQSARPAYPPLGPAPYLLPFPSPGTNLLLPGYQPDIPPGFPNPQIYSLSSPNPIRILQPDNMPCLIPNLSNLARMPVKRTKNADRMPNAIRTPQ
jgi:hypothetical protein